MLGVHIFELLTIATAVISSGYWFHEELEDRPWLQVVAGGLLIVLTLDGLFSVYGKTAKWLNQISHEYQTHIERVEAQSRRQIEQKTNLFLQKELIRLGCYRGKLDGLWGSKSKSAFADFLEATGNDEKYGPTVKVSDAEALFKEAPNNVCASSHPINQASTLNRYRRAYNDYASICVEYFLVFPVHDKSDVCLDLKSERNKLVKKLDKMGVNRPR